MLSSFSSSAFSMRFSSHTFRIAFTSTLNRFRLLKANTIYNCDSLSQQQCLLPLLLLLLTATPHAANEPKMQRECSVYVCVCVCVLATTEEPHPLPLAWIFCPQLNGCPTACCATFDPNRNGVRLLQLPKS